MDKAKLLTESRLKRRKRIRKKILGVPDRLRLSVFRSSKHIYAQIIDDKKGVTIVSASSLNPEIREMSSQLVDKKAVANEVGGLIAQRAISKGIENVSFDRGGYLYHGRIKVLADAARAKGLKF